MRGTSGGRTTQGYGPQDGGQGTPPQQQWGQPSPTAPGWGQGAPAAGGYPGAAGAASYGSAASVSADGANWPRVRTLGLVLLVGSALLLVIRVGLDLAAIVGAEGIAAANSGGDLTGGLAIGSSLVLLLLYGANLLLSIAMMILGVVAAVMGRGRARLGGVLVAAGIPVAVVLYWILSIVMALVLAASGTVDMDTAELTASQYRLVYGVDIVRAVLMVAVIGLGAFFVHGTARRKLSA